MLHLPKIASIDLRDVQGRSESRSDDRNLSETFFGSYVVAS